LELALQDAQSKFESAKENDRRVGQLLAKGAATQAEADISRQVAATAKHHIEQLETLLELYRKADPPSTTATSATTEK